MVFSVDQKNGTIQANTIEWLDMDKPDELIVSFTFKGKEVKVGDIVQTSDVTKNSFKDGLTYTVYAENGDKKEYRVTLVAPQINQDVPVLHFKMDRNVGNDYIKSKLEILSYGIQEGLWDFSKDDVEIRLRGNSTKGLPKKPYRVKFPEKFSPLGLNHAKAKSWVLLANDTDKTLLRNASALAMSRVLFDPADPAHDSQACLFTAATMHVNVFFNNEYIGLYTLSDQIQRDGGRIDIEKLEASDGNNPDKITGGYLMEVDIHGLGEPSNFSSSQGMRITPKYPDSEDHDPAQYEYIKGFIKKAEDALYGSDFGDAKKGWRKYYDETTAIDYFLVNELSGNPDGYSQNYFYKKRGYDKIFFGPVWDFDKAFNNDRRTQEPLTSLMVHVGFYAMNFNQGNHWFRRLWSDNTFKSAVKKRWNEKKGRLLAESLAVLDNDSKTMEKSIKSNFRKWSVTSQALGDAMPAPTSYAAGLSTLRTYIQDRYTFLDNLFNSY